MRGGLEEGLRKFIKGTNKKNFKKFKKRAQWIFSMTMCLTCKHWASLWALVWLRSTLCGDLGSKPAAGRCFLSISASLHKSDVVFQ